LIRSKTGRNGDQSALAEPLEWKLPETGNQSIIERAKSIAVVLDGIRPDFPSLIEPWPDRQSPQTGPEMS
jgi:hypothetical protein